eukprot:9859519-Ditylum_brightwellii.AAC.1
MRTQDKPLSINTSSSQNTSTHGSSPVPTNLAEIPQDQKQHMPDSLLIVALKKQKNTGCASLLEAT